MNFHRCRIGGTVMWGIYVRVHVHVISYNVPHEESRSALLSSHISKTICAIDAYDSQMISTSY